MSVTFTVNNKTVTTDELDKSLLNFLREDLGLTGAKDGCSRGQCGTCTVIVNKKAVRSCCRKVKSLDGAVIETIEGISDGNKLHPIQIAFLKCHAYQCGFCTPGMIMAVKALLDSNPHPTDDEIKEALKYNYCRCTGYVQIIEAVRMAIDIIDGKESAEIDNGTGWLGESPITKHGIERVTGTATFGNDYKLDGALEGRLFFPEHPHANILSIDLSEAEKMPGVVKIFTHKDIPGDKYYSYDSDGINEYKQQIYAIDKVRFLGDPIALVVADTANHAYDAMKAIKVEYEVLPVIGTMDEALDPNSTRVHEEFPNQFSGTKIKKGNVERAFAQSDLIVERDFEASRIDHGILELCTAKADIGEDGRLNLYGACQGHVKVPKEVKRALDISDDQLHYINLALGGGFGGRENSTAHIHAALAAWILKKPVRVTMTREEMQIFTPKKHGIRFHYKVGVTKDGTLTAMKANAVGDTGAYSCTGHFVMRLSADMGAGPYDVPNIDFDFKAVFTNNAVCGAMRGYGSTQTAACVEVIMDEIAEKLNISPYDLRMKNALKVGKETPSGQILEYSIGFEECMNAVKEAYSKDFGHLPEPSGPNKKVGIGWAGAYKNHADGHATLDGAGARVRINKHGKIELVLGEVEYGTGHDTVCAQIAAQNLHMRFDDIDVAWHDSDETPYTTGSTNGSRATYMSGNAVLGALYKFKEQLFDFVAKTYGIDKEYLDTCVDGVCDVRPEKAFCVSIQEIAEEAKAVNEKLDVEYYFRDISAWNEPEDANNYGKFEKNRIFVTYIFAAQIAIVEVDEITGEVKVLRVYSASDLGKAINPALINGQIYGGVMNGVGYALSEEYKMENGIPAAKGYRDLGVGSIKDTPEIIPLMVENTHPFGPYGAKGFSEGCLNPAAPAILNAIYDAVGVRIYKLPVKKDKLAAAINGDKIYRN